MLCSGEMWVWLVLLWQLHLRPESWKKELISCGFLVLAVDESDETTDLKVVVQFLKLFWHLFLLFVTYVEFLSTSSLCNGKDCEVTVLEVNWRVPDGLYHLTSPDSNQSTQCMKVIMEVNMDTHGKKPNKLLGLIHHLLLLVFTIPGAPLNFSLGHSMSFLNLLGLDTRQNSALVQQRRSQWTHNHLNARGPFNP